MEPSVAALTTDDELALQRIIATMHSLGRGGDEALELARQVARALLAERMTARIAELRLVNERLARAMQAKDAFLAGMSHELRTPLNAILGIAELLGDGTYGPLARQQLRPLETIRSNGNLLLDLINDILDLAKIEAGREELSLESVRPAEACAAALGLVAEGAQARGITLERRLAPWAPPLMADSRRLTQILVNLLGNALKFTPSGGTVGLDLAVEAGGAAIRFTVRDSGVGIAACQQRRLFQAFSQADGELSRRGGGSGLGLALVARLAQLHGGSVALESQPGAGCRISVTLPCAPQAGDPGVASARLDSMATLVIDEHEPTAQALASQLRAAGAGCLVAAGDAAASALARLCVLAAVFVALPMSDHQGEALLPRLRAMLRPATRLVAIGTVLLPDSAERALAAGADLFLPRPVLPGAAAALLL
jgi:signal transduction histidine kinase/CheY-like chemotaxis protein